MKCPELRTFVVISTAHLTEQTARYLDRTAAKDWPCVGGPYGEYGWLVYAHEINCDVDPDAIPADLFAVMAWAREQDVHHILFDCDGPAVDDLPVHDW